jgi:hypothetical protein
MLVAERERGSNASRAGLHAVPRDTNVIVFGRFDNSGVPWRRLRDTLVGDVEVAPQPKRAGASTPTTFDPGQIDVPQRISDAEAFTVPGPPPRGC